MGSTQQFCLKWNNHQSNMLSIFDQLLSSEHFVDVTLACEGVSVRAHKMVLSACSPFFQSLFIQNPCEHPIVILKDIRFVDLKALVQFMYRGEVNVSQDQLPTLLKAAEALKIKGLAEVTNESGQKPSSVGSLGVNGHHSLGAGGGSLVPKGEQPSVQAAPSPLGASTPIPTAASAATTPAMAQSALVAAMQQNALKAQLAAAAAAHHAAAQNAVAQAAGHLQPSASGESNSNASTPLRQTDSPAGLMSSAQQNRKRRRKSASSEKGSGDEGGLSGAEDSGADDALLDAEGRGGPIETDDESGGEEAEFEPSKLLEQTMTEVRQGGAGQPMDNHSSNSSASDNHTKDSDVKPVINFSSDSANNSAAAAALTLNPQDPSAFAAFAAAAAQAAGASANSCDSVAGPSQPTHVGISPLTASMMNALMKTPVSGTKHQLSKAGGWNNIDQSMVRYVEIAGGRTKKMIKCKYCDYITNAPSHYFRHEITHSKIKPFICPLCPVTFQRRYKIKMHVQKEHPGVGIENLVY